MNSSKLILKKVKEKTWLQVWNKTELLEYTFGNKIRQFFSSSLVATSWFLILAEAFRNGYVVDCSTACRSVTAKIRMDSYGTVPHLAKSTQQSSTADWFVFWWRHQIGNDGTPTERIFTSVVKIYIYGLSYSRLNDIYNYNINYCRKMVCL